MRFQAGGAVQEAAFYVPRAADRELDEALSAGAFSYVLATTQTGKSSLKVRAARSLAAAGARVAMIDLTDVAGESTTVEQWYHGLAWSIARKAGLAEGFEALWGEHAALAPNHRWSVFLREHLVPRLDGRMIVFLDEINVVLSLSFSPDAFFASLRELFDARAAEARLGRLTFCLLGIASPEMLMKDPARSPFRDSKAIVLDDFTRVEMDALLPGLEASGEAAGALLDEVYAWTHGHPYMTQRLCAELTRREAEGSPEARVMRAVEAAFLDQERAMDPNLRFAERYLARDEASTPMTEMLYLYRRLLEGEAPVSDPDSHVEQQLRLSGLAAARIGEDGKRHLEVRNRVFAAVFTREWVSEGETGLLLGEQLRRWLAAPEESKEQFVLRGPALQKALAKAAGKTTVVGSEGAFLRASQEVLLREQERDAATKLQTERADRAEEHERIGRRNRRYLTGGVVSLLMVLAVAGWQYAQAQGAVRDERTARQEAEQVKVRALATTRAEQGLRAILLAGQPGREIEGLLLGIDAVAGAGYGADVARPLPEAVDGMTLGLMSARQLTSLQGHTNSVDAVIFSPDGTRVLTASLDTTARLWDARDGKPIATLQGHTRGVLAAAFSPDGTRVVTASEDKTARLWDARDGKPIATLDGHTDSVSAVAFSPDGTRVLTGSPDRTARIWDASGGTSIAILQGHTDRVYSAAFSPDGTRVLTGSGDRTARLWDARDGTTIAILHGHTERVWSVAFSPDGTRALTGSWDTTARVWDARDGKPLLTLKGHTGRLSAVTFSPDGTQVLTGSLDATARLWDARDGKSLATLQGHAERVYSVAFSPDANMLLTGSLDATARLWNARDGKSLAILQGHTGSVLSVAFSPDGARLLTGSKDRTAWLWDARDGKPLATLRGHVGSVYAAAFSPDATRLLTGGDDRTAHLWDARDGKSLVTLQGHTDRVYAAAFSPDGTRVLTGSEDTTARLWDARDGKAIATLQGHTASVLAVAFSPDGTRALTGSDDKTARIWDARDGKSLATLAGHAESVYSVVFSPDGTRALTASEDKTARIWDARDGKSLVTLQGHGDRVYLALFSPDGTRALTASEDRTARIWDARDGKLLATLQGHTNSVDAIAFSPDGAQVLTGSKDKTARLWDARDGKPLATLQGHADGVGAVAFSPDGARVLTGSDDKTARLWDAHRGQLLAVLPGHLGPIYSVAFSPHGGHLVTAGADGTARIWPATPEGFLVQACQFLHPWGAYEQVKDTCAPYVDRVP